MQQQNGTAAPTAADSMARALEEYLAAVEAGAAPSRDELLARHPELAEDLDACLAALRFIGRAAEGPRAVAAKVAGAVVPEQTQGQLGDYRILREVGRGGMGVVYEAEQVSLGRRVALKVLPFAATMDPRQLQRFHNEARAAACLHHEHIVPVYAVGCERGVHFYAMHLIEGASLAELIARQAPGCDDPTTAHTPLRPGANTAPLAADATRPAPRDAAYFRQAARWGIAAAEALEYAHAMGVVHRDIKPANLLVDGVGKLWVADFGLARTAADTGLTMTGDVLGTLRYTSPEQALARHGLVDHRTDVYALGATLYELLTGRPAVAGVDRAEVLHNLAFAEPAAPRSLDRGIPAGLETVVLKTLSKEPAERYATAKELADDLRRFLEQRPVLARRPTLAQRIGKWTQRHRRLVGAALILIVVALAGLAASTALIWAAQSRTEIARKDAQDKRELAEQREAEAEAQRRRAEDNLRTVLRLVRTQQDLLDIVEANPGNKVNSENLAGWLEELIAVLEKVRAGGLGDPKHLWSLAAAYSHLGHVHSKTARLTQAESAYRQAAAIWASIETNFPTYCDAPLAPFLVVRMYERLAEVQRADGRLAEAEGSYREALRIGGNASLAESPAQKVLEAYCLCGLARCLLAAGRVQEGEGLYCKTLQVESQRDLVHIEYAWFLATRPDAAQRDPARAIALLKPLVEPPLSNARASVVLGVAQYSAGDWKAAATTLRTSVQQLEGLEHGAGLFLAMALWRLGEKAKAREQCEEAIYWTDRYRPKDMELRRFHAEAVRLLGLELLESARLCLLKGQLAAAARHFSAAFAADPTLVEDPRIARRAAACAARAGCGQGKDAGLLDAMERAHLRHIALTWLRAHLAQGARRLNSEPQQVQEMEEDLGSLQKSILFACVRDREALAKLPEAERTEWQKLWADVADTLVRAKAKSAPG